MFFQAQSIVNSRHILIHIGTTISAIFEHTLLVVNPGPIISRPRLISNTKLSINIIGHPNTGESGVLIT